MCEIIVALSPPTYAIDSTADKGDCADAVIDLGVQFCADVLEGKVQSKPHCNFNFELTLGFDLLAGALHPVPRPPL